MHASAGIWTFFLRENGIPLTYDLVVQKIENLNGPCSSHKIYEDCIHCSPISAKYKPKTFFYLIFYFLSLFFFSRLLLVHFSVFAVLLSGFFSWKEYIWALVPSLTILVFFIVESCFLFLFFVEANGAMHFHIFGSFILCKFSSSLSLMHYWCSSNLQRVKVKNIQAMKNPLQLLKL